MGTKLHVFLSSAARSRTSHSFQDEQKDEVLSWSMGIVQGVEVKKAPKLLFILKLIKTT